MKRYILKRIAMAIATIFAIAIVNFVIIKLVPGDPVVGLIGEFPAPEGYVEQVRRDFGLDQPIYIQLGYYLAALARGDFGFSFFNRQPVLDIVISRAGNTLLLMLPALFLSAILGIVLALAAAPKARGKVDNTITALTLFGYSMPSFWLAQVLVLFFAVYLGLLPVSGMYSLRAPPVGIARFWDFLQHIAMPLVTIMMFKVAIFARTARASILGVLHSDFLLTAKAKGLSRRYILWRHILPNSLIPIVAVFGYQFGHALTSSLLVETVFAWPGIGYLFVNAIAQRDFPVLQGILILASIMIVVANLVSDVAYGIVDPRIRRGFNSTNA